MSISALSSSNTSQLSFLSRLSSTNASGSADATRGAPPPRPPEGGGFASAIADALQAIGITSTGGGTDTAGAGASTSASSTDTADSADSGGSVADALGSFLQSLMGALHAQNAASSNEAPPYGEAQQGGGPGRLEADLQSLLSKLTSDRASTGSADSTSAEGGDAVSQLESSFAKLLDKLGGGGSGAGGTEANTKLAAFLQALSAKVGGGGTSGNLVNTTV